MRIIAGKADTVPPAALGHIRAEPLLARAQCEEVRQEIDAVRPAALFLLYLRAHWLRMPPLLLVRHLTLKAFIRLKPERKES